MVGRRSRWGEAHHSSAPRRPSLRLEGGRSHASLSLRHLLGGASMSLTMVRSDLDEALDALEVAVEKVASAALDQLPAVEELALVGRLERLRRRLDAGTDRAAGHLDRSAAF